MVFFCKWIKHKDSAFDLLPCTRVPYEIQLLLYLRDCLSAQVLSDSVWRNHKMLCFNHIWIYIHRPSCQYFVTADRATKHTERQLISDQNYVQRHFNFLWHYFNFLSTQILNSAVCVFMCQLHAFIHTGVCIGGWAVLTGGLYGFAEEQTLLSILEFDPEPSSR
jgi:hypothetical protein